MKGIPASLLFPTTRTIPPPHGDWYVLPVFPDVYTRRPSYYELFYQGKVLAMVEPNQGVIDRVLENAKGVRL